MNNLAKHIIAVMHNNKQIITNLQLQAIMYFTLKFAIQNHLFTQQQIQNIYDEPFLVWRYGPVVKSVYKLYKIYESDPITKNYPEAPELKVLNNKIIQLSNADIFTLMNKSHSERFWQANEDKIVGWRSNVAYSLADVAAYC